MMKIRFKLPTTSHERRATSGKCVGSALIIAVILTSLLAIIGMMFVMIARVDKMSTSSISQNKDLDSAAEAVVALVSQELILDVPGVAGQEYCDYPDADDPWLASLEPYENTVGSYYWRQISDVTGFLGDKGWARNDIEISNTAPDLFKAIIEDRKTIVLDGSGNLQEQLADADGDGVADSKWIQLEDMTSSKGKPIYAAVRIVDNGAMLNVNTAYKFDPTAAVGMIDGSSQLQINLMALASQPGELPPTSGHETDLLEARANYGVGVDPLNLDEYEKNVIWRYNEPNGTYTPFDISDELELRYRFLVNQSDIDTRLEVLGSLTRVWGFREYAFTTPADKAGDLPEWFISACDNAGILDPNYAYRHIGTTYNMDRIITPDCDRMAGINMNISSPADIDTLYYGIRKGLLDANYPDANVAAQIAVNLIDFRDNDSNAVTVYVNPDDYETYYGFERPCIYISEMAHKFVLKPGAPSSPVFPDDYDTSYAVELYKPYPEDGDPCQWQIEIGGNTYQINNWNAGQQYYVILHNDPCALLDVNTGTTIQYQPSMSFYGGDVIRLQRPLPGGGHITVDSKEVPSASGGWLDYSGSQRSIQRDITRHKCIRSLWGTSVSDPCLGKLNSYYSSDANMIQAHPENKPFTNVGEIGMVLRKCAYPDLPYSIDSNDTEATARVNLADPNFQQIFKYLTVFDPNVSQYGGHSAAETKVKGRININTAPWYVLAQLPWVSQRRGGYDDANLARAIVAYRDKVDLSTSGGPDYLGRSGNPGFVSIGELTSVVAGPVNYRIDYYDQHDPTNMANDQLGFPDLTPGGTTGDGAPDDFEERDVIFSRISNLVTVRSDVLTAYILVRVGSDGPQKRVLAILDRSNVRKNPDYPATSTIPYLDKVRIIAIHPVPDPR